MNALNEIWDQVLENIKPNTTDVTFNILMRPMNLVSMENGMAVLEVDGSFNKSRIQNQRYQSLIEDAFFRVTSNTYHIRIMTSKEILEQKKKDNSASSNTTLNPKYTFETFVVGSSNRFAHAGAIAVANNPGKSYNPLFVYGGVGLGKTHIMHAIGHHIQENNPSSKIMYVSSEKFTNELIFAIQSNKNVEFRQRYRSVDVLLIDDIQFIGGKESAQEEIFHTFNELHEAGKQIVISSDKQPKEIPRIEERLRSRFEWGLIADIQRPDYETRVAILKKKAELENFLVSNEVLEYIADNIESNIRELEGSLSCVKHYAELTNLPVSVDTAKEALKGILLMSRPKTITPTDILDTVCDYYSVSQSDLMAKKRTREIAYIRQISMYLIRNLTDNSFPQIGELLGGRDHSTVMHAHDKISREIQDNIQTKIIIDDLISKIKG